MSATIHRPVRTRRPVTGVTRLVRRLDRARRPWLARTPDVVPTELAWRAGVAEGLRLAQTVVRKGA